MDVLYPIFLDTFYTIFCVVGILVCIGLMLELFLYGFTVFIYTLAWSESPFLEAFTEWKEIHGFTKPKPSKFELPSNYYFQEHHFLRKRGETSEQLKKRLTKAMIKINNKRWK